MSALQASQLNYSKDAFIAPNYKLNKVFQQSGGQTVNLNGAGGQLSVFELPAGEPINLARSFLSFTLTTPVPAGGTFLWSHSANIPFFRQIQFGNRGGVYPVDLYNADVYTKVSLMAEQKLEDFKSSVVIEDPTAPTFYMNMCAPSQSLLATNYKPTNVGGYLDYDEVKYTVTTGAAAATLNIRIPLRKYYDTMLADDRSVMFNEVTVLRLIWNGVDQYIWSSTNAGQPYTGPAAIAGNFTVNNLSLYIAQDNNPSVKEKLKTKLFSDGISVLIPYVWSPNKLQLTGTGQQTSTRVSATNGIALQKVLYTVTGQNETLNTTYDTSNVAGAKIAQYYTQLNGNRVTGEANIDCTVKEDYLYNYSYLRGSSYLGNPYIYQYNWVHIDKFDDVYAPIDYPLSSMMSENNVIRGKLLDREELKYDFIATNVPGGIALNHYAFPVTTRVLNISAAGMSLQ